MRTATDHVSRLQGDIAPRFHRCIVDLRPVPSQQADVKDEIAKSKKEMFTREGTGGVTNRNE